MSNRFSIGGYVIGAVVLGAIREFLFVNLNYQIDHVQRGTDFSYAHSAFQRCVEGLNLGQLQLSKWLLTILVAAIVLWMTIRVARLLFARSTYDRLIIGGYMIVGVSAFVLHLLSNMNEGFRMASVQLLHALQFPVVMVILILASTLVHSSSAQK